MGKTYKDSKSDYEDFKYRGNKKRKRNKRGKSNQIFEPECPDEYKPKFKIRKRKP